MSVIGRINGPMLKDNLLRQGVDLAFETNLLFLDVNNHRIGINNSVPNEALDITGNVIFNTNLKISGANISSQNFNGNITLTPNGSGKVVVSYLTPNRIPIASTSGSIVDDANLSFVSNTLITSAANIANLQITNNQIASINTNANINLTPNGTGIVVASKMAVSDISANQVLYASTNGRIVGSNFFTFDGSNLYVNGNLVLSNAQLGNINVVDTTITTLKTNANLNLQANGTGKVVVDNLVANGTSANSVLVTNSLGVVTTDADLTYNSTTNLLQIGNLSLQNNTLASTNSNGNINFAPNGNGLVVVNTTTGLQLPSGTSGQRSALSAAGTLRWNNVDNYLEYFDGSNWHSIIITLSTITSDLFNGDGSTITFTLSQNSTTSGVIVSINGVLQKPLISYTVNNNLITFTEIPQSTDVIEVRTVVTSTTISKLSDNNTSLTVDNSLQQITLTVNGANNFVVSNSNVTTSNYFVVNSTGQSVGNTATVIDSWSMSSYSAAKYIVTVKNGVERQVSEVLVTHNGSAASQNQYSVVNTGSSLGSTSVGVNGSNVELKYTGTSTGNTVKLVKTLVI